MFHNCWAEESCTKMHFMFYQILTKTHPKCSQNTPQNHSKWFLFGAWGPLWNHDATRVSTCALIWRPKTPKRDACGTLWAPSGPTNLQDSIKKHLKAWTWKQCMKQSRYRTLPNLKKYGFTSVKHTFSKMHLIQKKKPKWDQNGSQMAPKST